MATRQGENPDVLHRKAQVRVLSSMAAGGDDVFELIGALAAFDVHHHFTPDVALLEVAATALGLACLPGSDPLEYEGLTDRYLPDQMLSGRTLRQRTQYAIYAAACIRGGLLPDLLREAGGWEPRLWTYAVSAVVLYTRATADRRGQTVPDVAIAIARQRGLDLTTDSRLDRLTSALLPTRRRRHATRPTAATTLGATRPIHQDH